MKKIVQVGKSKYTIEDEVDLVNVIHELAKNGYTPSEIAILLGISRKKVQEYLEDCW
jgi:hypothetical protein